MARVTEDYGGVAGSAPLPAAVSILVIHFGDFVGATGCVEVVEDSVIVMSRVAPEILSRISL